MFSPRQHLLGALSTGIRFSLPIPHPDQNGEHAERGKRKKACDVPEITDDLVLAGPCWHLHDLGQSQHFCRSFRRLADKLKDANLEFPSELPVVLLGPCSFSSVSLRCFVSLIKI